jgi:NifB/MoaA-like Fe-S oxidoreductase
MQSVSIVPAGLTKYREKLYPLEQFTPEEASAVIDQVDSIAEMMREKHGIRMFYCADELYLKAGRALPDEEYYDGYPQIENGVGMITSTLTEFYDELDYIDEYVSGECVPVCLSIATGVAAFDTLSQIARDLESRVSGLKINVYKIINNFFGESITVAGLLTGKDIAEQLCGRELGQLVLFPENSLRQGGDLFLDDMSPDELSERLGVPVAPGHNDGAQLIRDILSVRDAAQKR